MTAAVKKLEAVAASVKPRAPHRNYQMEAYFILEVVLPNVSREDRLALIKAFTDAAIRF